MLGPQILEIWESLPPNPAAQLQVVREYATRVLGKELAAAAWLGRASPAVLDGKCLVSEACRTREGFREAMLELIRISRQRPEPAEAMPTDAAMPRHEMTPPSGPLDGSR